MYLFEKTALDPVSDLERIGFYKELIDAFPKNHPLKRFRGDVYFDRENLEKLFSNMKKEDWMPDFINERINERLENLKHDEKLIYKISLFIDTSRKCWFRPPSRIRCHEKDGIRFLLHKQSVRIQSERMHRKQ